MTKQDRYSEFRQAEKSLQALQNLGTELVSRTVDDSTAQKVSDEFSQKVAAVIEADKSFGDVMLTAYGGDVLAPLIHPAIEDDAFSFKINPEKPQQNLTNFAPAIGTFASVVVGKVSEDQGSFHIGADMYLKAKVKPIDIPYGNEPFMRIERTDFVKVPLRRNADVSVAVRQLELLRAQKEAFLGLSKSGLSQSIYAKKVHSLGEALASEKPHYVKLNDVSLLHAIGRLGKKHADELEWKDDRITEPLIKTLGRERQVTVKSDLIISYDEAGDAKELEGRFVGKVIDVCASIRDVDSNTLLLVLQDSTNPSTQAYVPLDEVKEFWF